MTEPRTLPTTHPLFQWVDLAEIQRVQDTFARAMGVASVITDVNGCPLTRFSNQCRVCRDLIGSTNAGQHDCLETSVGLGHIAVAGSVTVRRCAGCGFFEAGVPIVLAGRHLATWRICQVRDADKPAETLVSYAHQLGLIFTAGPVQAHQLLRQGHVFALRTCRRE